MWLISRCDLVYRRRRFVIAVLVTALVFGMALIFDGVKRSVQHEVPRVVALFGADSWVVARGVTGPFTSTAVLPGDLVAQIAGMPGVRQADPVILSRGVARLDPDKDVNVVGYALGGLGTPPVDDGRAVRRPGEVVVDKTLGLSVGERLRLGAHRFRVVGVGDQLRYNFGAPTVFMGMRDARRLAFDGRDLEMAVVVRGDLDRPPAGLTVLTNDDVIDDLNRITKPGIQTINIISVLLWIVAIGIIGSIVYLNALERTRDFAVLKATGSANRVIVGGLALQSLFLSVVAAVLAVGVAFVVGLGLPFPAELETASFVQLFGVAIVVGILASLIGARRALTTDPALAFAGA